MRPGSDGPEESGEAAFNGETAETKFEDLIEAINDLTEQLKKNQEGTGAGAAPGPSGTGPVQHPLSKITPPVSDKYSGESPKVRVSTRRP